MPSTNASDTLPTNRTVDVNRATTLSATRLASWKLPFRPSMICSLRPSRRNACTARMPFMVSTKCTMILAIAPRVPR